MENKDALYEQHFTKEIIKWGRLTNLLAIPLCFIPAGVLAIVYGAMPAVSDIFNGWLLIVAIYGIYAIVEPVSYFPVLGLPGTYMSFLAGNISNMRVPCSAVAQEAVGVVPGSKRAELVSTLGIAGSIITNLIVVAIAAIGGAAIMSLLPPIVLEGFKYVSTAIFAGAFGMYAGKKPLIAVFAIALGLFLMLVVTPARVPVYLMIPVMVFSTVGFGFFLNSQAKKKAA